MFLWLGVVGSRVKRLEGKLDLLGSELERLRGDVQNQGVSLVLDPNALEKAFGAEAKSLEPKTDSPTSS